MKIFELIIPLVLIFGKISCSAGKKESDRAEGREKNITTPTVHEKPDQNCTEDYTEDWYIKYFNLFDQTYINYADGCKKKFKAAMFSDKLATYPLAKGFLHLTNKTLSFPSR
ncbi:hypothetical protein CRE_24844 [Caenorhabditis remanei]|uniref:Lipocalin n=1 Tax=Caenorhabditis remanei TaxID=31234 RepID=E3NKH0_CAERE|nr:hypothetical protein CRE_24844 [Caenorhabditis remanei]